MDNFEDIKLNLSILTKEEQEQILRVLKKDDLLRKNQFEKIK